MAAIISQLTSSTQPQLRTDPLALHWRGDAEYEEARVGRVFNLRRPERYPVAVLEARDENDVIRGVNMARERGLQVALRSGGHAWAVWSVRSGTLLIDLGRMKELSYDPITDIATCSPAITGGELNPALAKYGRFFGGGHCPTVGLGGFLLQGGQGWGARGWGWACEQIVSMDIVLPSGQLVTASEKENSDLFWAARGSGPGFFGVIVRFRLKTRPKPMAMYHITYIIPAKSHFKDIICWQQRVNKTADSSLESVLLAFTRVRLFGKDKLAEGQDPLEPLLVMRATAQVDSEAEARRVLQPFLECPHTDKALVKAEIVPTSMAQEYAQQLADNPPGRYFSANSWLVGDEEDVADSLELAFTTLPSAQSFFLYYSMAPLRPLPDMAFSLQTEHYTAGYIIANEEDPSEDEKCNEWLKARYAYIDSKKDGPGGTIGMYLGDSDLQTRPGKIMTDANWEKFCKIRDKYDPNSLFIGYLHGDTALNTHAWEQPAVQ